MNAVMRDAGRKASDPPIQVDPLLAPGQSERFKRQVEFLLETDKLKHTLRQTILLNRSRRENSVEHSWHIALSAMVFSEYANDGRIDFSRVIRMLLIHDLVEIDAGDTYCYDAQGRQDQAEREQQAAERIFGLLPADQAADFRGLWDEFEARRTPESRFAHAMDRFQAFLHNYFTGGQVWRQHEICKDQVVDRMQPVDAGASVLWEYVRSLMDDAVGKGFLAP